jgi:hypothetical protein
MPDTSTEIAIATTNGNGSSNSITFSSIPSTYTDLRLVATFKSTVGTSGWYIYFNGDNTNTYYSRTYLAGDGASAISSRNSNATEIVASYSGISTTIPTLTTIDVMSYAGSTFKTSLISTSADRNGSGFTLNEVGLFRSTSAISSLTFKTDATAFTTDSTFTLYGIL